MKKVYFQTLGCKTNQYETQAMREKFAGAGFCETQDSREADLLVINTCTVTGEGDRKSRAFIRRFHRDNPEARIAVTGCYATLNASEIASMQGVTFIIPNQDKDRIVERVVIKGPRSMPSIAPIGVARPLGRPVGTDGTQGGASTAAEEPRPRSGPQPAVDEVGRFCGAGDQGAPSRYGDLSISYFADRARAFVKIQDGCNHSCTYCKVVLVRGGARSRPLEDIVSEVERLRDRGYREVVLTGIQLGSYGDDWKNGIKLVTVLEALVNLDGIERIRMSSIDPSDVTGELIDFMASHPKVCSHLHLPLQSGDDSILKRMRRAYRVPHFLAMVERLKRNLPDFALTTDVMVGFPGEQENHFQNTVAVLEETLPLKVHIFPFSPREGTQAWDLGERVPAPVCRERIKRLESICSRLSVRYRTSFMGRTVEVLVESEARDRFWEGHTASYLKVGFQAVGAQAGSIVPVKLLSIRGDRFDGIFVNSSN